MASRTHGCTHGCTARRTLRASPPLTGELSPSRHLARRAPAAPRLSTVAPFAAHIRSPVWRAVRFATLQTISLIFMAEMAAKLVGMGCAAYWADGWNKLDGSIVSLSVVEMLLTVLFADTGVNISFLRMLRLLRLLRLLKAWPGLYKIIVTLGKAMPQMSNILVLMSLTLLIFALLGMQLFGGAYGPETGYSRDFCPGGVCPDGNEEEPRFHFDYFIPAMYAPAAPPPASLRACVHTQLSAGASVLFLPARLCACTAVCMTERPLRSLAGSRVSS